MTNEEKRRADWLADRRKGITSGNVAAILGIVGSPMDVWLDKMGLAEETPQNERMVWGLRLQRAILEGYADRVGHPIVHADPYQFVRFPGCPILGATLDARWADGDMRPVDAKNVGIRRPDVWGPDGSNIIPYKYAIQLHVQMMVTGTYKADLAVLFGGNTLNVFTVERDPEVEKIIVDTASRFWEEHVDTGLPPAFDGGEGWRRFLQTIPQRDKGLIEATPDDEATLRALVEARERLAAMEEEVGRLEAKVKASIGEHAGMKFAAGKVTWKQAGEVSKVDWEEVARVNREQLLHLHPEMAPLADAVQEKFTTKRAGSRRFLMTLTKEEP